MNKKELRRTIRIASVLIGTIFLALSLISHNPYDPSLVYHTTETVSTSNLCGTVGAWTAALFFYFLGSASLLIILVCGALIFCMMHNCVRREWDRLCALTLFVLVNAALLHVYGLDFLGSSTPGGLLGSTLYALCARALDPFGAILLLHCLHIVCIVIITQLSLVYMVRAAMRYCKKCLRTKTARRVASGFLGIFAYPVRTIATTFHEWYSGSLSIQAHELFYESAYTLPEHAVTVYDAQQWQTSTAHADAAPMTTASSSVPDDQVSAPETPAPSYQLPVLGTSEAQQVSSQTKEIQKELQERANLLQEKLERMGIAGTVITYKRGPVVTLFEYEPHIDTKLNKIVGLEHDLALALQAMSVRIIAPIAGTAYVGFEVANKHRERVAYGPIVRSAVYKNHTGELPLVLGQDTSGGNVIVDLAKMPHLLIAGSTGSGKSVALNSMLISLLCARTPAQLKLIIIDPKRLDFGAYADIGHLLFPIIVDPKGAVAALTWVVREMESRYDRMAREGARTMHDYNARVGSQHQMPRLVVVIDELADLMMTAGKLVEDAIIRITQMARAAGIHMLVATQRPSVDVITGLIKVNFPSRIAFRVTSKVDSRTILDCSGADMLLGHGDMLFLDGQSSTLKRVHGAYISDEEIQSVVAHIRQQQPPAYLDFKRELAAINQAESAVNDDPLYDHIVQFLHESDEVSISLLQRKFHIGYNRSARIIEMLESQGLLVASDNGKTRKVVK